MLKLVKRFLRDESGAVTVDWVVLTAAVVGLATAAYIGIETQTNLFLNHMVPGMQGDPKNTYQLPPCFGGNRTRSEIWHWRACSAHCPIK